MALARKCENTSKRVTMVQQAPVEPRNDREYLQSQENNLCELLLELRKILLHSGIGEIVLNGVTKS